MNNVID